MRWIPLHKAKPTAATRTASVTYACVAHYLDRHGTPMTYAYSPLFGSRHGTPTPLAYSKHYQSSGNYTTKACLTN
jgi:hypothetical protein